MKKSSKFLAMLICILMIISMISACAPSDADDEKDSLNNEKVNDKESDSDGDKDSGSDYIKIDVGISTDPADISPFVIANTGRNQIMRSVYEYLGTPGAFGAPVEGILMESCEFVEENGSYMCKLYDNIVDSAGNKITSEDVKFCVEMCKEKVGSRTKKISEVIVHDELTFELVLTDLSYAELGAIITMIPIVSQKAYEESPDGMLTKPISTGPYIVEEYVTGSTITLKRNENYWRDLSKVENPLLGYANPDEITYHVILEPSQMSINLETGIIDIAAAISTTEAARFQEGGSSSEGFVVHENLGNSTYCLFFNNTEGNIGADKNFRQACAYAIDVYGIMASAVNGNGVFCKALGPTHCDDFDPAWHDLPFYEQDLDKAKDLLDASSYDGETLRLLVLNNDEQKKVATMVQSYLSQIGVVAELKVADSGSASTLRLDPTEWDLQIDLPGCASGTLTATWNFVFETAASTTGGRAFVHDDKLWELLAAASYTGTHSAETMNEAHEYMSEQLYIYPMFVAKSYAVHVDTIESLTYDAKAWFVAGSTEFAPDFK